MVRGRSKGRGMGRGRWASQVEEVRLGLDFHDFLQEEEEEEELLKEVGGNRTKKHDRKRKGTKERQRKGRKGDRV